MSDHETIRDQAAIRASWDGDDPDVTRIVRRVGAALNSGRDAAVVDVVLDEVAKVRAGVDRTPRDPAAEPTPGQLWAMLLDASEEERLMMLERAILANAESGRCFREDHPSAIQFWKARADSALAAIDRVNAVLDHTGYHPAKDALYAAMEES